MLHFIERRQVKTFNKVQEQKFVPKIYCQWRFNSYFYFLNFTPAFSFFYIQIKLLI
jgi:hypothetical protein